MGAFHQVGHDSENLLFTNGLEELSGAILSPLNYEPDAVAKQISRLAGRKGFRTILDPHLYRPRSERGCLPSWSYYPKDVETTDFNPGWWSKVVGDLVTAAKNLGPTDLASPAMVPKLFSDDYYVDLVAYGEEMREKLAGTSINPIQTIVAKLSELTSSDRVMTIASITSKANVSDVMLVLISDLEPRRELRDPEELKGAMKLIAMLEANGQRVTVAWSSSDMVLWKAAGATNCASGKFFNLRRFTISRFDEPNAGGGGQLGYWFEENLLAFLRQSDILRIEAKGLFSDATLRNPFSQEILEKIKTNTAWLALSWRHFLWWFADAERRLSDGQFIPSNGIETADDLWKGLETSKPPVYMEERLNDGGWVREWRRAIAEFPYFGEG